MTKIQNASQTAVRKQSEETGEEMLSGVTVHLITMLKVMLEDKCRVY